MEPESKEINKKLRPIKSRNSSKLSEVEVSSYLTSSDDDSGGDEIDGQIIELQTPRAVAVYNNMFPVIDRQTSILKKKKQEQVPEKIEPRPSPSPRNIRRVSPPPPQLSHRPSAVSRTIAETARLFENVESAPIKQKDLTTNEPVSLLYPSK